MKPYQRPQIVTLSFHLAASFQHWTGRALVDAKPDNLAETLYHAPFVLVAHGGEADPVFCYANLAAQKLWQMDWDQFTKLPSRLSAEPEAQGERQRLLALAEKQGYVDDYRGVRITTDGRRFSISDCLLWNTLDETLAKTGQAARFSHWEFL